MIASVTTLKASEHEHQATVFEWAGLQETRWPVLKLLHSIPNGGGRGITKAGKRLPPLIAVKLKREGLRPGIPDIHLPAPRGPFCGLYIEMKAEDGKVSDKQKEMIPLLRAEGNFVRVCYSSREAIKIILDYIRLPLPRNHILNLPIKLIAEEAEEE